jgi:hypothetical protein
MISSSEAAFRADLAACLAQGKGEVAAPGPHPSAEELVAYHGGRLSEDEGLRLQGHLVACPDCLAALLELDSFVQPAGDVPAGVPDLIVAAAWRALKPRLAGAGLSRRAFQALAAGLAVTALGLGLWSVAQRQTLAGLRREVASLSRPQPTAAIVDLFPAGATRGEPASSTAVELPAEAAYLTLILNLPPSREHAAYGAEISDREGRALWSGGGLARGRFGTVRLGLPGRFLAPGEYRLQLFGLDGEARHPIESYAIRVPEP